MNIEVPMFTAKPERDKKPRNRVIYRCQKPKNLRFGVNEDGEIVVGLTLVPYCVVQHDFVAEDVSNVGAEASLLLPDAFEDGMILEAFIVNTRTDWETGCIDDWEIELKPITDPAALAEIEALRESLEREEVEQELTNG